MVSRYYFSSILYAITLDERENYFCEHLETVHVSEDEESQQMNICLSVYLDKFPVFIDSTWNIMEKYLNRAKFRWC